MTTHKNKLEETQKSSQLNVQFQAESEAMLARRQIVAVNQRRQIQLDALGQFLRETHSQLAHRVELGLDRKCGV